MMSATKLVLSNWFTRVRDDRDQSMYGSIGIAAIFLGVLATLLIAG
jgi:hypothetical protein